MTSELKNRCRGSWSWSWTPELESFLNPLLRGCSPSLPAPSESVFWELYKWDLVSAQASPPALPPVPCSFSATCGTPSRASCSNLHTKPDQGNQTGRSDFPPKVDTGCSKLLSNEILLKIAGKLPMKGCVSSSFKLPIKMSKLPFKMRYCSTSWDNSLLYPQVTRQNWQSLPFKSSPYYSILKLPTKKG